MYLLRKKQVVSPIFLIPIYAFSCFKTLVSFKPCFFSGLSLYVSCAVVNCYIMKLGQEPVDNARLSLIHCVKIAGSFIKNFNKAVFVGSNAVLISAVYSVTTSYF